jgi:methylaspartate ammonia-lyase
VGAAFPGGDLGEPGGFGADGGQAQLAGGSSDGGAPAKTPDLGGIDKTVEALLHCRKTGVGAYSGGSANETDRSAQVSTNVAIACAATQCLAKPGLGVDEGLMIVSNEMNRVLALAARRGRRSR